MNENETDGSVGGEVTRSKSSDSAPPSQHMPASVKTATMLGNLAKQMDTTTMLAGVTKQFDTTTMLGNLAKQFDTTTMLAAVTKQFDTAASAASLVPALDTATMLGGLTKQVDTAKMLAAVTKQFDTAALAASVLPKLDAATMLAGVTKQFDTAARAASLAPALDTAAIIAGAVECFNNFDPAASTPHDSEYPSGRYPLSLSTDLLDSIGLNAHAEILEAGHFSPSSEDAAYEWFADRVPEVASAIDRAATEVQSPWWQREQVRNGIANLVAWLYYAIVFATVFAPAPFDKVSGGLLGLLGAKGVTADSARSYVRSQFVEAAPASSSEDEEDEELP